MRRLLLALGIVALAALWALLDPHAGVRTYRDLGQQLRVAQERTDALRAEVAALEDEAERLEGDPLAIEAAIRAELGLARPGEIVVRAVPPRSKPAESLTR
jgi:cell division protein FtsB